MSRRAPRLGTLLALLCGVSALPLAESPVRAERGRAARAERPLAGGRERPAPVEVPGMPEAAQRLAGKKVLVATGSAMPNADLFFFLEPVARDHHQQTGQTTLLRWMATFASRNTFNPMPGIEHDVLFISKGNRDAVTRGTVPNYRPISLYEMARDLRRGTPDKLVDTVVVKVGLPRDAQGNVVQDIAGALANPERLRELQVSLGTDSGVTVPAIAQVLRRGGQIVAEMNPFVPFVASNTLRLGDVTAFYRTQSPMATLNDRDPNPLETVLMGHAARLIPDGATVQAGIGAALTGFGTAVADKRGLKIHTEMLGNWARPLLRGENAVREVVASFAHGDGQLYAAVDGNPNVKLLPADVVNDPRRIARIRGMHAVNTALEVDLSGNTGAEQVVARDDAGARVRGDDGQPIVRYVSSPGGQKNFMEGAARAPEGKAIIALRSRNKWNEPAVGVASLQGRVTTPGRFVTHVVTEWGASADLRHLRAGQRAAEIIRVAHPLDRATLAEVALAGRLINRSAYAALRGTIFPSLMNCPAALLSHDRAEIASAVQKGVLDAIQQAQVLARIPEAPAAPPAVEP